MTIILREQTPSERNYCSLSFVDGKPPTVYQKSVPIRIFERLSGQKTSPKSVSQPSNVNALRKCWLFVYNPTTTLVVQSNFWRHHACWQFRVVARIAGSFFARNTKFLECCNAPLFSFPPPIHFFLRSHKTRQSSSMEFVSVVGPGAVGSLTRGTAGWTRGQMPRATCRAAKNRNRKDLGPTAAV